MQWMLGAMSLRLTSNDLGLKPDVHRTACMQAGYDATKALATTTCVAIVVPNRTLHRSPGPLVMKANKTVHDPYGSILPCTFCGSENVTELHPQGVSS